MMTTFHEQGGTSKDAGNFRQSLLVSTPAAEALATLKAAGIILALDDSGSLVRFGAELTPELRELVNQNKTQLLLLVRDETDERTAELIVRRKGWFEFANEGRGYDFSRKNGFSEILKKKLDVIQWKYVQGRVDLKEVHKAFNNYAKAHKTNYFNRQLVGTVFDISPKNISQRMLQIQFEILKDHPVENDTRLKRVRTTSVTPQTEAAADQIERMKTYFGITEEDYIKLRITK